MLLCSYELNTLDPCWIAVNVWSNSSRCRIVLVYLTRTWCLCSWSLPRYTHNYAQFCQLLNSNLFTHHRILMLLTEATSETYGPRGYLHHIILPTPSYFRCFLTLLLFYFASLSQKYQKNYLIISIRSHSRKWPCRNWQPLIALVARIYLFCAGTRDSRVASYWIDTLVLKNWGKYLRYFAASPFPLQGKTNAVLKR